MKTAPNQNRKIIYGLIIVVLFGAMFPTPTGSTT